VGGEHPSQRQPRPLRWAVRCIAGIVGAHSLPTSVITQPTEAPTSTTAPTTVGNFIPAATPVYEFYSSSQNISCEIDYGDHRSGSFDAVRAPRDDLADPVSRHVARRLAADLQRNAVREQCRIEYPHAALWGHDWRRTIPVCLDSGCHDLHGDRWQGVQHLAGGYHDHRRLTPRGIGQRIPGFGQNARVRPMMNGELRRRTV